MKTGLKLTSETLTLSLLRNGAQNSHQTNNLCTYGKLSAKTIFVTDFKCFNFFRNFFFDPQHVDLAPRADLLRWQPCSLFTKKQQYARTICTVHVHAFLAPRLDWNLANLGRMCWIPEKTDRKNLSLLLHAPTSPVRIWE